jgi:hypothetical protein
MDGRYFARNEYLFCNEWRRIAAGGKKAIPLDLTNRPGTDEGSD